MDLGDGREVVEVYAILERDLGVLRDSTQVFLRSELDHGHTFRAQALSRHRYVPGRVSRTDDRNPGTDLHIIPQLDVFEEVDRVHHFAVDALLGQSRHTQRPRLGCTRRHEDRGVLLPQLRERHVPPDTRIQPDFHAGIANELDIAVHDRRRQSEIGDGHPQHPSRVREGLEDGGLVAHLPSMVGAAQPGGSRADNGDPLGVKHVRNGPRPVLYLLEDKPLERTDRNRLIHLSAVARVFARMGADHAAGAREGVGLADKCQGLLVLPLGDQRHVPLCVHSIGAVQPTGRDPLLRDREHVRDGLWVQPVDGRPGGEPLVEPVLKPGRAHLFAVAAAVALLFVDETGTSSDADTEIAGPAVDTDQIGVGEDLDVGVTAGLHQLGGDHAHGAVIGGERLVQLGHIPADGRLLLEEEHLEAGVRTVEGGLHAGYPGTHHQHRTDGRVDGA